jgi:hypothetical protein
MIARLWRGWTTPENADTYEKLLKGEIFTRIKDREIAGEDYVVVPPKARQVPKRFDALPALPG